jgi:hypothetical protein
MRLPLLQCSSARLSLALPACPLAHRRLWCLNHIGTENTAFLRKKKNRIRLCALGASMVIRFMSNPIELFRLPRISSLPQNALEPTPELPLQHPGQVGEFPCSHK